MEERAEGRENSRKASPRAGTSQSSRQSADGRRGELVVRPRSGAGEGTVAVCLTVLNETASIDELLGSLAVQTRLPDEVVITDGGSTDGTLDALGRWRGRGLPLTILHRPGDNISAGRNAAIRSTPVTTTAGWPNASRWPRGPATPWS